MSIDNNFQHTHQCYLCTDEFICPMTDQECDLDDNTESCLCDDCATDVEEGIKSPTGENMTDDDLGDFDTYV